jgi:alpha-L-fucosidase
MTVRSGSIAHWEARLFCAAALLVLAATPGLANPTSPRERETDQLVLKKLEWFQDMKLGLLMHWGPYSQWGVVESWSICPEDEDWCRRRGPFAESYDEYRRAYENLKTTFNPVKFDPASWAAAAREAGMRYVIFTTKHHDGFSMFDTKETNYRITDRSCPFSSNPRSNVTKEIFNAFRLRGFGIGVYFSKADWHSPDYWWPYFPPFDRNVNYDIARYPQRWEAFKEFTHNQIKELMSDYGLVDILWLDGGWVQPMTPISPRWGRNPVDQNIDMPRIARMARSLQPGLIIVDRAVEGPYQNYRTPEQEIPGQPPDYVWETCMTMATSWSYAPTDTYKSARELIHTLASIVAKGGNLLLNIGPSPEGELPPTSLDRLRELGEWMTVNGEAIYRTRAIAPYTERNIRFTRMPDGAINAIYLADEGESRPPERIRISSFIPAKWGAVAMLGVKEPMDWEEEGGAFIIHVSDSVRAHPPCRHAWAFRFSAAGERRGDSSGSLDLLKNGRSDFSVYVAAAASPSVAASADTLRRYIRDISGAQLAITHELKKRGHQIVFEAGESADQSLSMRALGSDGFRIRTAGGNLCIAAGSERGIQNAVYTFLETYLGCRKYSPTVEVIPKRDTITLPDIDDTQVPPVAFRMQNFLEPSYAAWHKLNNRDDWGLFVHTFATLVPPEKYFKDHPEYFSLLKGTRIADGQLCLTNPDVFRIVVGELRSRMKENPRARFWSVSQNDTYCPCECDACRTIDSAEGTPAGSILSFVNRVADEFPDKIISTLAYQHSRSAPIHMKPRPNVNIMLCSIECNRSRPLDDDPASASFVKDVKDWGALTDNIFLWDYVIQFRNLVSPFPNLRVLQPNIRFFAAHGITSVFEQGFGDMHGEFAELRSYLIAKLLWNPYIDVDWVIDDFLRGYYGGAAPFIRRYIDTMHDALAASGEDLLIYGYPWPSRNGYLSPDAMETYDSLFNLAEDAVKGEPDYLFRVQTARLPLQFAQLEQAKVHATGARGCFTENGDGTRSVRPEIESLLATFVERCKKAGTAALWEHGTSPDQYFASTRAFFDQGTRNHLAKAKFAALVRPASPKYHDGDARALTDALKGWDDYHMHWLGFEGEDMEATIDLGAMQSVSSIGTAFLQDINSWVFMPITVEFSVSEDGRRYRRVGEVPNTVPAETNGAIISPFGVRFEPLKARFVRVKAVNMKMCPPWHKGAGGKAWIFIDEITVL